MRNFNEGVLMPEACHFNGDVVHLFILTVAVEKKRYLEAFPCSIIFLMRIMRKA